MSWVRPTTYREVVYKLLDSERRRPGGPISLRSARNVDRPAAVMALTYVMSCVTIVVGDDLSPIHPVTSSHLSSGLLISSGGPGRLRRNSKNHIFRVVGWFKEGIAI